MMVTVPAYFTAIVDKIDVGFVPHAYISHVRLILKSGSEQLLDVEDFEMLFDMASRQGEEVAEFLMADKIALVIDYNKVYQDVHVLTNSLLAVFGPEQ